MNKEKFKNFIKEARLKSKLTQQELALILNVDVTAVSKWERGVSYPDITLIQDICKVLDISEHELLDSCKDEEYRKIKKDANKYNKIKDIIFTVSTICYLVAIISCFIINLAVNHTLSWFFIVLTSCICGFMFIPTCLRFFDKNKLLIYLLSTFLSLVILFITISIYTYNYWCLLASVATLLGYILIFYPFVYFKYLKAYKRFFLFSYFVILLILTILLEISINAYVTIDINKALNITLYSYSIFVLFGITSIFKLKRLYKLSINSLLTVPYFTFLYVILIQNIEHIYGINNIIENASFNDKLSLSIVCSISVILSILFLVLGIFKKDKVKEA